MDEILILKNLTKTFTLSKKQQQLEGIPHGKRVAVSDLSFSLRKGELYGLLGTNGAGKTTTLRMLATLIRPDSGSITLDGIDALRDPAKIRSRIGFLTSELKLEDFFTPNYMFDFFAGLHGLSPEVTAQRKQWLFGCLGIDKFAEVKIRDLSTGMKQKTSIAISLAHDPDIVIFDEPTNGLDIITAKAVTDFLLSLKEAGKTVVISSHIFDLIEKTCDRVGILIDGKMAWEGQLTALLAETTLEDKFFSVYSQWQEGDRNA